MGKDRGRAHLASGRAESSEEARAKRKIVAQRRIVCEAEARAAETCLELGFVSARTHEGWGVRMLNLIDEHSRECLAIRVARWLSSHDVIDTLSGAMILHGIPEHVRSYNSPEFVTVDLRKWLADTGSKTLHIEPGSPWEDAYCESFNSKLRDEFLNGEICYSLKEPQILCERWQIHYNAVRPHSLLNYRPPAAWRIANYKGHGEVETATPFPLLHTPDSGYPNSVWFRYF